MPTSDNTATNPRDVYQKVTDAIINAIEQGAGSYRMPWVVRHWVWRLSFGRSCHECLRWANDLLLIAFAFTNSWGFIPSLWLKVDK
jgi:antirestriction protein ArdC